MLEISNTVVHLETQDLQGTTVSPKNCPIARALNRHFGQEEGWANVTNRGIRFKEDGFSRYYDIEDQEISSFVDSWDNGEQVSVVSLVLTDDARVFKYRG